MKIKDFIKENGTRTPHNLGAKLMLDKKSFLIISGCDSDVGREMIADKYRINKETDDIPVKLREIYARCVKEWSFSEPITINLVVELFTEYPAVYDSVISFFTNRENFIKGRPKK